MHRARSFFYVCAGLFVLALAYHLGARNAGAQAPGSPVVAMEAIQGSRFHVMTANGDLYTSCCGTTPTWSFVGNVFGGPVPAQRETFGALKSRYRGAPGAAQPAPQDR